MNISAEMKINLLTSKIDELKEIFTNEPLEKLQTLYFAFQETSNNTKKKRKKKKNSEENNNKVDITADVIENENNVQIEKDE